MGRKIETTDFYTFEKLKQLECPYMWAIGQRSNGKTFDGKKQIINDAYLNKGRFVVLKRRHNQITRAKMMSFFEDLEGREEFAQLRYGDFIKYSTENGFYILVEGVPKTVGYAVAIEDMYANKGVNYVDVKAILFDEVIEDNNYLNDEITLFLNTISTIVRNRSDVNIYMTANTVNRYCPYFDLFGIDITKLKKGSIASFYNAGGASIAVEYCKTFVSLVNGKRKNKYLGFDENLTSKMILHGDWQYSNTNTSNIDGIGWSCKNRLRIDGYVTFLAECYEMSILSQKNPIAFVRKVNTQNGKVSKYIQYNFSADNSINLSNSNGLVPIYLKNSHFIDSEIRKRLDIVRECISCGRVVFDTTKTGTEFITAFNMFMK